MKKLILSAAIILGSFSAFAQTTPAAKTAQTTQTTSDNFAEVKIDAVPEAVKTAVKNKYPTAVIDKMYINDKNEYKLDVTVDQKTESLYADASGNWIKK